MIVPVVAAPAAPGIDPAAYGFNGLRIGVALEASRAARPKMACASGESGGSGDIVTCHAPDAPLGGGYFARDLTYVFVQGRLAQIRFRASIDGFAWVMARLKTENGEPLSVRRDTVRFDDAALPHVLITWRNGRSTIALSDPVRPPTQLRVEITRDDARPATAATGA